jgi:ubiquitin-protein ligase
MRSLRDRRIENEWILVQQLAEKNIGVLASHKWDKGPDGDRFHVRLEQTNGLVHSGSTVSQSSSHEVVLLFPRFFPSVPIEAKLLVPVFHPNVEPATGFVCLWERFWSGDTTVHSVRRLQRIISWDMFNTESHQIMQREAVAWHQNGNHGLSLPLSFKAINGWEELATVCGQRCRDVVFRRRLSTV